MKTNDTPEARVLSLRPAWAWAVIHGPKRVENRTWGTPYRGRLWIHASQGHDTGARLTLTVLGVDVPDDVPQGAILGSVDLVDVVRAGTPEWIERGLDRDPFATGPVCLILQNPEPLAEPVPCRGQQRFFRPPAALAGAE